MRQRLCSVTWTSENAYTCAWSVRKPHQRLFTICAKNPIGNEINSIRKFWVPPKERLLFHSVGNVGEFRNICHLSCRQASNHENHAAAPSLSALEILQVSVLFLTKPLPLLNGDPNRSMQSVVLVEWRTLSRLDQKVTGNVKRKKIVTFLNCKHLIPQTIPKSGTKT